MTNKDMKEIRVPEGLTERQVQVAQAWVINRRDVGGSIADFCKGLNLSTATWYEWNKDFKFNHYIRELTGFTVTDDERQAYQQVKAKIIELATSKDAGIRELELYNQHFSYVVEDEKRKAMDALGIQPEGQHVETMSLEERRNALFAMRK